MKYKVMPVKNVARLSEAGNALINRAMGMPGIGLVSGNTGLGKTTAASWLINQCHGVYVRAMSLWSPKTMLSAICKELDIDPVGKNNTQLVDAIIIRLAETGRPLFVDEADYVVDKKRLTDTLRDIHDLSSVPVIIIGMGDIEKKIRNNPQFTGRIAQWVKFEGLDMEDAQMLATGLCEVSVASDLLSKLYQSASPKTENTGAEIRRLVVGLGRIEQYARARGLSEISLAEWPNKQDFFIGNAAKTNLQVVGGSK